MCLANFIKLHSPWNRHAPSTCFIHKTATTTKLPVESISVAAFYQNIKNSSSELPEKLLWTVCFSNGQVSFSPSPSVCVSVRMCVPSKHASTRPVQAKYGQAHSPYIALMRVSLCLYKPGMGMLTLCVCVHARVRACLHACAYYKTSPQHQII